MNERKISISIVIPAFNEAKRLPAFLNGVISYCNGSENIYEIIIVDDGSNDKTFETASSYKARFSDLSVVKIKKNRGKGHAVKRGLLTAKGEICLFLDADGSVNPNEIEKNLHYILEKGYDIFVGSRVLRAEDQVLKVKWYRKVIGLIFNFLIHSILFKNIKDTQCGFKMFKRKVVGPLFSRSYIRGFGFDIEILYLAHKMGYRVKEGPVSWHNVSGSKVNLFTDSIIMFINILQTRNWHFTPINYSDKYLGPDEYRYMYEMERYHWWFVSHRNLAINLIGALKIQYPTILDVGAGTGGNMLSFSKLGTSFGIDISEKAVEFCKKRGLRNIACCPVEKISYEDKTFDIITCMDVLEHVSNPIEALQEVMRVLKEDGKIIITVPAFKMLWSQHDEALCHLRRYNKMTLIQDLEEAGLKIERIGHFFFASFFVVAPIRIIRRFLITGQKIYSDTTTLPPKFLNEFLKYLFRFELKISNFFELPLGTTLYAVCSKQIP